MNSKVKNLVMTGLFTALLCVLAPISIPMPGGVGVSLATFIILLITYAAGMKRALICCLLYLIIGAAGLPVFSGFLGGVGRLIGATGGYLAGYIVIVIVAGLFMKIGKNRRFFVFLGGLLGFLCCYVLGNLWYMYIMNVSFGQALLVCVLPFAAFDIIKIALVCIIGPIIKKHIKWDEGE